METIEQRTKLENVKKRIVAEENPVELVNNMYGCHPETKANLAATKEKIAEWKNPVEIVNNIYGCHPGQDGIGYFQRVYSRLKN